MKILHVCPRPGFSGLESYALQMARAQAALGHSVTFVVLPGSPLESRASDLSLMRVHSTWSFQRELSSLLVSDDRPDIIHLHSTQDLDLTMVPLAYARAFGPGARPTSRDPRGRTRVVLQTHIWISHSKRDPLHWMLYSLVDEMWCSSEPARETLQRFIPISPEKIRVIRYGRDIPLLTAGFVSRAEARLRLGLPMDATVVGVVARIDAGKGVRELLDACVQMMASDPSLHLIWIGPPTGDDPRAVELGASLEREVAASPFRSRLHFPGAVADSYKYLRAFDLFALPTYAECFSLALLEAQLAGLPCLATSSGGSPQIVREGETGWLFEPRSSRACFDALSRALRDRALWRAYGERAHEQVVSLYDSGKILPTTIEMYREILA